MASPPYNHNYGNAVSPPYPSNAQLPQSTKRRQTDMPSSAPGIKRRKTSMLSTTSVTSAHPLRQTSFPPENGSNTPQYSRSPSIDTMSLVSGSAAGGPLKAKRSRKQKGPVNDDSASVAGGRAPTAVSSTSGKGRRKASRDASADEEDEGGEEMAITMVARTQEEKQKEIEHRAMLVNAFDPDQFSRYEAWRSSKLSDSVVRRLVNQTLSQSAPASVILAVKSVAKIYAGEIIERARKTQSQWLEASAESQTGLPSPPADADKPKEKETRRGPLLPDHLRESIRRYMLGREGALAGLLGLWQHQQNSGVERFGAKVMGKRLLK